MMKNLKRLFLGLAALVIAFGLVVSVSAFKKKEAPKVQEYFWYSADGETPMGYGVEPNGGCAQIGVGCAKAYLAEQELPAQAPTSITRGFN